MKKKYFIQGLAMLLGSGISLFKSFDIIISETKTGRFKKTLMRMKNDIDAGLTLWKSLENSNIFDNDEISLIRIGEESGTLVKNLELLFEKQQKQSVFRSRIISALIYPSIILLVGFLASIFIAWFIIPNFVSVFVGFDIDLPIFTQYLILLSDFIGHYGFWAVLIIFFPIFTIIYFIFFFKKTKFIGYFILNKIPGIKGLLSEIELARFGYSMNTLLSAGVSINQSLFSIFNATSSPKYQNFYISLKEKIEEGNSFKKSFVLIGRLSNIIPFFAREMIIAGEESGNLSDTFLRIGKIFEERSEITIKNLTIIIEPLMLIIIWIWVVIVVLAIILPIYNLIAII